MKFFSKRSSQPLPQIQLIQTIDVSQHPHYHEAILFCITKGVGALKTARNANTGQLLLHNVPLLEMHHPGCPTCAHILQRGYDLDIADCPELYTVSQAVNENYIGISHALKQLSPLLGLLSDGLYLLADVPHFPTDGSCHFFWNAPYAPTEVIAACDWLYCPELLTTADSFPAYLYPTQSAACLQETRIAHYLKQFRSGKTPQGIAYHTDGFISALLDGHHKACAAAQLGQPLDCLTIIPATRIYNDKVCFCDLSVPIQDVATFKWLHALLSEKLPKSKKLHHLPTKHLSPVLPACYAETARQFPKVHDFAMEFVLDIAHATDTDISKWLECPAAEENAYQLQYLLQFRARQKDPAVRKLALRILDAFRTPDNRFYYFAPDIVKTAFCALLPFRDDEVEQVFIDYLLAYPWQDKCSDICDIVKSYWDDNP